MSIRCPDQIMSRASPELFQPISACLIIALNKHFALCLCCQEKIISADILISVSLNLFVFCRWFNNCRGNILRCLPTGSLCCPYDTSHDCKTHRRVDLKVLCNRGNCQYINVAESIATLPERLLLDNKEKKKRCHRSLNLLKHKSTVVLKLFEVEKLCS